MKYWKKRFIPFEVVLLEHTIYILRLKVIEVKWELWLNMSSYMNDAFVVFFNSTNAFIMTYLGLIR